MSYSSTVLADSPLLYWKLDDALASTTAADSSTNSNTGTVTAWTFRQASQLPGSAYGSTPTSTSGKIVSPSIAFGTSQITVEAWVNFNGTTGSPTYMLWSFGANYLDMFVSAGKVGINTGAGDQYGITLPGAGVHHIVAVMPNNQATTNAKIYIDGALQTLSGTSGTAPNVGTTTFQVSNWQVGSQGIPNGVYVDEVAVYSGALSAARVLAHYSAGATTNDLFANAFPVADSSSTSIVTTGFTTEVGESLTCPSAATAWYTVTPAVDGVYQIDTIGSSYDTGLSVYSGTTLANLVRVAYDDNSGGSLTSRLALELIGGTQYYVQAGSGPSSGGATGTLIVNVTKPATYNGFGSATPAGSAIGGANQTNIGTAFYTTLTGHRCAGARIYILSSATGDPTGAVAYLYAASGGYPTGSPLATANFPTLVKGGWTEVRWPTPVAITPGTAYYVVAYVKAGMYFTITNKFLVDLAPPSGAAGLIFPQDSSAHHNGVFADNTSPGTLPSSNFSAEFLGVDVIMDYGLISAGWK